MTNPSVLELEPVPVPCVILAMAASINREGRPLHLLNFWAFVATSWNKPILLPTDRALRPKTVHGCKRRHARACINVASQRFAAAIWNVPPKGFVIRGGQKGPCPMLRFPGTFDRDVSAKPSDHEIDADIAALFASPPPTVDEFFADSIVRMRIGMLITQAMNKPTRPRR